MISADHKPIVVGVDGSDSALEAVRWAAREAGRRRARLRVVGVSGWMPTGRPGGPGLGTEYRELLQRQAHDCVAAGATAAEGAAAGVEVIEEVLTGSAIPRLVAEAEHAQLVVVGHRGLGGVTGLMVGSVAVGLVAHAGCPVVVVRGDEPGGQVRQEGPVVVGVDGSPNSEAALAFAFEAAAARRAPLMAVHAWQDVVPSAWLLLAKWPAVENAERQVLAERLAGWSEKFPQVHVQRVVTKDRPAHMLIQQSSIAQLVVVGSRGHGALVGLVLGSVGHALLHHAACPVAVVRPELTSGPR